MAAVLLPLALVSCSLPQVDDIAFVSAQLVKASDIPKQDRNTVDRSREGPFLRLTFTSSRDFQKLARDWNYSIGWNASPCRDGGVDDDKRMDGNFALFDGRGPVWMYDEKRATSGSGPLFRYHVYLSVKAEANPDLPADARQYAYDLAARQQDVCFRISGMQEVDGDGWGFAKFRSNAATISQAIIAKALGG